MERVLTEVEPESEFTALEATVAVLDPFDTTAELEAEIPVVEAAVDPAVAFADEAAVDTADDTADEPLGVALSLQASAAFATSVP